MIQYDSNINIRKFIFIFGLTLLLISIHSSKFAKCAKADPNIKLKDTGGNLYILKFRDEKQHQYIYNNNTNHHNRKKKVRKKQYATNSYNTNEFNYLTNFKFEDENVNETVFINYPRNPFGPSYILDTKVGDSKDYDIGRRQYTQHNKGRRKRGVTHLYNMVLCATGCDPLSYKGYGCYCGFLGSGESTDNIDRCCMLHDICYTDVNCPIFLVYLTPYIWRCWQSIPQCAVDHLGFGGIDSCAARLCECDRQLALCLSQEPCPNRRALCTSSPWRLLQNIFLH